MVSRGGAPHHLENNGWGSPSASKCGGPQPTFLAAAFILKLLEYGSIIKLPARAELYVLVPLWPLPKQPFHAIHKRPQAHGCGGLTGAVGRRGAGLRFIPLSAQASTSRDCEACLMEGSGDVWRVKVPTSDKGSTLRDAYTRTLASKVRRDQ